MVRAFGRVSQQQEGDELLELVAEVARFIVDLMHGPELANLIFFEKERVAWVISTGLIEWYVLCAHEEKDHAAGKQVSLERLVLLIVPEFRRHVLGSSKTCSGEALVASSSKGATEAEICKLDIVILIKKAVLRFEITMRHVILVHVEYSVDDLVEEVLAHGLTHVVVVHDEVEEVTLLYELHTEQGAWFVFFALNFHDCVCNELVVLDQTRI